MKKGLLELEFELQEGDITPQGYIKKKKKLLDEISESNEELKPKTPTSVLTEMTSSSVHSTLNKIFNKKGRKAVATKRKAELPIEDDTRRASKKSRSADNKESAITVVRVEHTVISIPKDKLKLKELGLMQLCLISPMDSKETVAAKLNEVFNEEVKILRATKSNDLFESAKKPATAAVQPTILSEKYLTDTSTSKNSQNDIDWDLLRIQLKDHSLIHSYKMDSTYHIPDISEDDDISKSIRHSSQETLLCRNHIVDLWIDLLQATNTDLPKLCHHFYVVPEERMLEFDKFSEDIKKMDIDGCIRKRNEVSD